MQTTMLENGSHGGVVARVNNIHIVPTSALYVHKSIGSAGL